MGITGHGFAQTVIYPNPTSGDVSIKLSADVATLSVQVTNVLGQSVGNYRYTNINHIEEIPLGAADGVYFVTVTTDVGLRKTFKVIKQ